MESKEIIREQIFEIIKNQIVLNTPQETNQTLKRLVELGYSDRDARMLIGHIDDEHETWRIVYRTDSDAIVILEVFEKKTRQTPKQVIGNCKQRIRQYDDN